MYALIAASSHHSSSPGIWFLLLPALTVGYLIHCAIYPFRPCRRCDAGRLRSASGKAWRYCRHCQGTGGQLRIGRRVLTGLKTTRDRAKK
ncbi:hypothetical protein [Actinomadura oligospora]|uniref:hypothetical protein n=1 Tax=Actinomadura oligospora TaxID=111804 RepID=UPI0004AF339F|nr:hypothetical protein [Actinomadura oligospora]